MPKPRRIVSKSPVIAKASLAGSRNLLQSSGHDGNKGIAPHPREQCQVPLQHLVPMPDPRSSIEESEALDGVSRRLRRQLMDARRNLHNILKYNQFLILRHPEVAHRFLCGQDDRLLWIQSESYCIELAIELAEDLFSLNSCVGSKV